MRTAQIKRQTKETNISVILNLDGRGKAKIFSGVPFLDHMLEQIARHGNFDLEVKAKGDLEIEAHHTIEDLALVLGQTFKEALGDKKGIERYGFYLCPLDEALSQVVLDFSGRPYFVWQSEYHRESIGNCPTEMFEHFFKSFSDTAQCNLHIKSEGRNDHHKIESTFKAFARSLKMATSQTRDINEITSTKGSLNG
jgi:imidazoleglycerol-phosphate dehydratase/histidinol-phosphatase